METSAMPGNCLAAQQVHAPDPGATRPNSAWRVVKLRSLLGPFAAWFLLSSVNVSAQSFLALPPHPITPGVSTQFGGAVSVSGPTIAVGAITNCCELYFDNGAVEGFVFLYRYSNGARVHQTTLSAPAANQYNGFGGSISVSGNVLVVGAPFQAEMGKAYVYRYDGVSWGRARELKPSDPTGLYEYGGSVAVVGEVAVVGTVSSEAEEFRRYVFRFNGEDWIEEAVLGSDTWGEFAVLCYRWRQDSNRITLVPHRWAAEGKDQFL